MIQAPAVNISKLFSVSKISASKLECLLLASQFSRGNARSLPYSQCSIRKCTDKCYTKLQSLLVKKPHAYLNRVSDKERMTFFITDTRRLYP
jgi:hypothetical protein